MCHSLRVSEQTQIGFAPILKVDFVLNGPMTVFDFLGRPIPLNGFLWFITPPPVAIIRDVNLWITIFGGTHTRLSMFITQVMHIFPTQDPV